VPGEEAEGAVRCLASSQCCLEKHLPVKMRRDADEAVDADDDGRKVPIT